ncbi:HYC_CC_PP family protein [Tenacibaculum maritimum]|uniref:Secreted protein n=1 Tax=Tenacibaculum maritimum NCIMB 2154 TaxID=1349785 RepID=A0A2H1E808_9FLAO|nr:hypothetical protein [Tenacibaculum maritimum]QCD61324.1 hypothetical protein B9C57_01670 [Tenacibaculum maritimum]CAA0174205.1 Protein of unknown function [Tenacibaculum maritimum]CAA0211082.1 Protein of unknown function [Tenacibaculum maritimum]SFZ80491.1 Protein of unknown function [Tenacibaculum maritimum NCIMB 2154]
MKLTLTKIAVFVLSLLVLFSTVSFSVEKHFCGDFLVDVSFLGTADSCAINVKDDCSTSMIKKKCCKDELHKIEGQKELKKEFIDSFDFSKQKFAFVFLVSYYNLFQPSGKGIVPHENYSPPDLIFDIQLLHEVFII